MPELVWDAVGSRRFEAGLSKGVLYPPEGSPVPWNGLLDVSETKPPTPTSHYLDGVKYADRQQFADYQAKLTAFTYPLVLDELTGLVSYGSGLGFTGQRSKRFGLSYRTGIGDDLDPKRGYKIHFIYNILATPTGGDVGTVDANVSPTTFEWQLDTKPIRVEGFRPTAHFIIDSTKMEQERLDELEGILYGTPSTTAHLPDPTDILNLFGDGPAPDALVVNGAWTMDDGGSGAITTSESGTAFSARGVRTTSADENEYTMESK